MFRGRGSLGKAPLKGLFADGIWQCNCDPRLPAEHFQTKNGGINHGRWFYTCQKPQPKRCNFFLWDDEAKPREAAAVLNNSRSEAHTSTKQTAIRIPSLEPVTPYTPSKPPAGSQSSAQNTQSTQSSAEEFYEWPSSEDDELAKVVDRVSMPPPETPRKAVKTDAFSTPGKRRYDETALPTPTKDPDDVFTTPMTGLKGRSLFPRTGLPSPAVTPSSNRFKDITPDNSELATEVLNSLRDLRVELDPEATTSLKEICSRHTLKIQGITRGRDISRMAIKTKDARIAELQNKISRLEAERETNKAVIRHLRRDIELSKNNAYSMGFGAG
ncbi:hypothetical protein MMC30_003411 [Trapelia coarctata]|nr:hypothetical protein [Trapelia coarctata]